MEYNITYRQKDKGWQFIISYKINEKWKQKSKQGFNTKKDTKIIAEKMAIELNKQIKDGAIIDESYNNITFKKLVDVYLKHLTLYKEYNTLKCYEYTYNKFSSVNELKVKNIRKVHIQECVNNLIRDGLRTTTISSYVNRVKLLLQYYQENFNSTYFIFNKVKFPKEKAESRKKALSKSELDGLLVKLKGNKYYLSALLAGTCGLRCGEILGLTWKYIDFDNSQLIVKKQWKIDKKTKESTFGELKTKNSNRIVPIPPQTLSILKKYKSNKVVNINNRIAPYGNGCKRYLNPVLRELAGITIHEVRHTYATLLISNNIDFKTTANFLGHDVQQTIKTYSHVTDEMKKKATDTISKIFCN